MKEQRRPLVYFGLGLVIMLVIHIYNARPIEQQGKPDADERPHYKIDPAEQAFYDDLHTFEHRALRSKNASTEESYVGGKIKGTWSAKQFSATATVAKGYRTISAAYDKHKDIVYVISHAGHLWRIDYDDTTPSNTQWTAINHTTKLMTKDRKEWFDVMNVVVDADTLSRTLFSFNDKIYYSDNEGAEWTEAQGVSFQVTGNKGCIVSTTQGQRAATLAKIDGLHKVAYSYDGINYTKCSWSLNYNDYETTICKPHHSENVYVIARRKADSKVSIYRMTPQSEDFELIHEPTAAIPSIKRVMGTYVEGACHFYAVIGNESYYSSDEGATWAKVDKVSFGNTDGNTTPRTLHPNDPNTLFRGYLDVYMSQDQGANYKGWSHKLGWDVHYMRMFERRDGSYMHLIANDFGVFMSYTPENKATYFSVNHTAPTQMAYDMDVSDNFGTAYTALQDRGSREFSNTDAPSTGEIRSTDALRVTLANQEKSIWTWMYFGSVYHAFNSGYKSGDKCNKSIAGSWTAGCMVAYPDATKDAVLIAHGDKLKILTYNEGSNSITKTDHHVNFKALSGQAATSVGYSPLNKNRWYVAVKDGHFYYSEDGGNTFKASYDVLAKGNDQSYNYARNQQVIKGSKLDEQTVYFAGVKNAFYISKDGGKTFTNHADGLDVWRFRDFALSEDEKFIFGACANAGIWVFDVEADKWFKMDGPNVPYVDFTGVNYTPSKGMVQFSSFGYGILDFKFSNGGVELNTPSGFTANALSFSEIKLKWEQDSTDVDGYILKRSEDVITYTEVARLGAGVDSFIDVDLNPGSEYFYRLEVYKGDNASLPTKLKSATTLDIEAYASSEWTLLMTSSQEGDNDGAKAFDGNVNSMWQASAAYPQEIQIDMGEEKQLAAFTYTPTSSGKVKSYELYISNDKDNWGAPATKGTWASEDEAIKTMPFDQVSGRYVRFIALSGFDSGENAAIGELKLWPGYDLRLEPPVDLTFSALGSNVIMLKWNNVSANVDGYIIERLGANGFEEIARVGATKEVYIDTDLEPAPNFTYRIMAFRFDEVSDASETLLAEVLAPGLVANAYWSILNVDSEQEGKEASFAIDNDESTWWHSQFSPTKDPMPHELQIDMAKSESLVAFTYLPRTDNNENGTIKDYEFYVSNDKDNWGEPVAKGTWTEKARQTVSFDRKEGRYIRLLALSELNGKDISNCAELLVWNEYEGASAVSEIKDVELTCYPNPFNERLSVELESAHSFDAVQLLSTNGQIILEKRIRRNSTQVQLNNVSDLNSGMYLLRLTGNEGFVVKKVMKR